jgi:hypothetical protein
MISSSPPQFGQCPMSISNTRLNSLAQHSRTGPWCVQPASHSAGGAACAGAPASCGTASARNLAVGARTPWSRMRCSLGLGTSAASRCMTSSGDITRCVVPSRQDMRLRGSDPGMQSPLRRVSSRSATTLVLPLDRGRREVRGHPAQPDRDLPAARDRSVRLSGRRAPEGRPASGNQCGRTHAARLEMQYFAANPLRSALHRASVEGRTQAGYPLLASFISISLSRCSLCSLQPAGPVDFHPHPDRVS